MSLVFDLTLPRRDFELSLQGEMGDTATGVFGPSGAGKTSFFSLLTGLETPASGRIVLNGKVLTDMEKGISLPANKRRIGVVFQDKLIFPHLSIRENLLFGERYVKKRKISLEDVVDLLDLSTLLDSMPHEISGGEQQRTAIGRALLTSPELLLLDEPFNAVDNTLRTRILPYLKRVRDTLKIPMLVISHDLPDIQRLTSQVYLIEKGRCRGSGDLFDLLGEGRVLPDNLGMVNTFNLYTPREERPGLFTCSVEGLTGQFIKIPAVQADRFCVTIQPNEIALSRSLIDNISMQNQIRGKIRKLIHQDNCLYCLVDAGIRLIAEVTAITAEEMNLREGMDIVCLFKAHSLKS